MYMHLAGALSHDPDLCCANVSIDTELMKYLDTQHEQPGTDRNAALRQTVSFTLTQELTTEDQHTINSNNRRQIAIRGS